MKKIMPEEQGRQNSKPRRKQQESENSTKKKRELPKQEKTKPDRKLLKRPSEKRKKEHVKSNLKRMLRSCKMKLRKIILHKSQKEQQMMELKEMKMPTPQTRFLIFRCWSKIMLWAISKSNKNKISLRFHLQQNPGDLMNVTSSVS